MTKIEIVTPTLPPPSSRKFRRHYPGSPNQTSTVLKLVAMEVSASCRGADCTQRGDGSPLETSSSLIAKEHTVTRQVKLIGQRGRPALLTGAIIHDASTLLLVLTGDSISRYKEPNKKAGCFE